MKTAFRMFRCERRYITFVFPQVADVYIYLEQLTESYSIVRHSIYSLVSFVIFDVLVVLRPVFLVVSYTEFCLCNKCCYCDYLVGLIHRGAGCPICSF